MPAALQALWELGCPPACSQELSWGYSGAQPICSAFWAAVAHLSLMLLLALRGGRVEPTQG